MDVAVEDGEYECPYCGFDFDYAALVAHVVASHSGDNPEEVCPICAAQPGGDASFKSRYPRPLPSSSLSFSCHEQRKPKITFSIKCACTAPDKPNSCIRNHFADNFWIYFSVRVKSDLGKSGQ